MAQNYFWICNGSHISYPELIHYSYTSIGGDANAYKPRELFKAVRLFNGAELQLPQAYIAAPDVKIDASTLILCLEFSDGELLPLTHAPASEKEGVEKLSNLAVILPISGMMSLFIIPGIHCAARAHGVF